MRTKTASAITAPLGGYVYADGTEGIVTDVIINEGDTVTLIVEGPAATYRESITLPDAAPVSLATREEFEAPHQWFCGCAFCRFLYS